MLGSRVVKLRPYLICTYSESGINLATKCSLSELIKQPQKVAGDHCVLIYLKNVPQLYNVHSTQTESVNFLFYCWMKNKPFVFQIKCWFLVDFKYLPPIFAKNFLKILTITTFLLPSSVLHSSRFIFLC